MAAIANIVINDGETVPVAHTLTPIQQNPDAVWRDSVASLPLIAQITAATTRRYDKKTGLWRVRIPLKLPVMEAITNQNAAGYTAAPKIAHVGTCNVEFIFHDRSSFQNRKNVRTLVTNLLSNAIIVDLIDNLVVPL